MSDAVVGLFAKHPEPGRVKTRLGEDVGMERAAQFYAESLAWIILRLDESDFPFHLFYAPVDREESLKEHYDRLKDVPCHAQRGNDLGQRMLNAVRCLSDQSSGPVLIVGSDSPDLPLEYLRRAREALVDHDVVFGPAEDGGYYLIGMNEPQPALFEGMEWSHSDVLDESLERARRASLETETLPVWTDYDRVEDFRDVLD